MVVRILRLCLLLSPIARTIAAFHISLSVTFLHTVEVSIHIRALPVFGQFSEFPTAPLLHLFIMILSSC